VHRLSRH